MRSNVDEAPRPHGEGVSVQENPFLEVRDIVKNFGGVRALDGVNMAVWPGEVLCLAGENGCGKSTLIKVISGVHAPDAGRILIDGHTVSSLTPLSAMDAGIQVIYQDFSLFSNLTVVGHGEEEVLHLHERETAGRADRRASRRPTPARRRRRTAFRRRQAAHRHLPRPSRQREAPHHGRADDRPHPA